MSVGGVLMGCVVAGMWLVAVSVAVTLFTKGGSSVGWGVAVVVVAAVLHLLSIWLRPEPGATQSKAKPQTHPEKRPGQIASIARPSSATPQKAARDVVAGREVVRLASQGRQAVAGESHYRPGIGRVVGRRELPPAGQWESGLQVGAVLVRDPSNKHDRNAVRVYLESGGGQELAGYLPADVCGEWQPLLSGLERDGKLAGCPARLYADSRGGPMVVLRLSPPAEARFGNEPPGLPLLAAERECAVTGENAHQDVLGGIEPGPVWASLYQGTVPAGKYAGQATIEVRIDDRQVGTLTAAQGARYGALIAGGAMVCEARVFDGARYREVALMLPRID